MQHKNKNSCKYGLTKSYLRFILEISQICNKKAGEKMKANLIKSKLAEKNMSQADLAKSIGMSTNSLSRKLTGKREFTIAEANAVCTVLKIDNPAPIFFENLDPKMQHA